MSKTNKITDTNKKNKTAKSKDKNIKKKISEKISASSKKQKKKTNLLRLCSVMNNYSEDANDKEIIKRFKTTIISSINEDISKTSLTTILKKPEDVNIPDFSEIIQPYIKHYLFMYNRSVNKKNKKK